MTSGRRYRRIGGGGRIRVWGREPDTRRARIASPSYSTTKTGGCCCPGFFFLRRYYLGGSFLGASLLGGAIFLDDVFLADLLFTCFFLAGFLANSLI